MSDWLQGMVAPEQHAVATDFMVAEGPDLLGRWDGHRAFWDARLRAGLDPYGRIATTPVGPEARVLDGAQEPMEGLNFASRDPLGLARHPLVRAAATAAIGEWGVHAAGTPAEQGTTLPVRMLEERLADLLCCREAIIFPSAWAAGQGLIQTLIRPDDHVVLDLLGHPSLQRAASMATRHVHRVPHGGQDAVLRRLARIRAEDARPGILVVTESLHPLDSSAADIAAIHAACRRYGATLLVCMSQDFGAMGDTGLGLPGDQGMTGEIDLVLGSFSTCLAANGGFVATSAPGLRRALNVFAGALGGSGAMSPVQAAAALAALDIVRSPEGARRRRRLRDNVLRLRSGLSARSFEPLGQPSPVVLLPLGEVGIARLMTRAAFAAGALVNLLEPPAVPNTACRWRLHVMADHSPEQIDRMAAIAVAARDEVQTARDAGPARGKVPP